MADELQIPALRELEEMTDGRMSFTTYYAGELFGSMDALDAVKDGVVDVSNLAAIYAGGAVPCANVESGLDFLYDTLAETEFLFWWAEPRSWEDVYREEMLEYGVFVLGSGPNFPYGGLISTVPIQSTEDIDGLLIRSFGSTAMVWESLGAEIVTIPGAEIYTALALGTIDASNYGGTTAFKDMSAYEVAGYWIGPHSMPWQETGFVVNLDSWNALTDDLQALLLDWCRGMWHMDTVRLVMHDVESLNYMIEQGLTHLVWPEEEIVKLRAIALPIWDELAEADAASAEMVETAKYYARLWGYID